MAGANPSNEDNPQKKRQRNHSKNESFNMEHDAEETDIIPIRPLIIADVKRLKEDHDEFKKCVDYWFRDIEISEVKFTKNNNMLIFPKSKNDYNLLLKVDINYQGKKIEELAPKNIELVLKGITFEQVQKNLTTFQNQGVISIKKMTSAAFPQHILKKVRITCENEKAANTIRKEGLSLGYLIFRTEELKVMQRVLQCYKCQQLGHLDANCRKEKRICVKCGADNHETNADGKLICTSEKCFCALCGEEHTSAYSKCKVKLAKIAERTSNSKSYAQVASGNPIMNVNQNYNNFIEEMKTFMKDLIENFKSEISQKFQKIQTTMESIQKIAEQNAADIISLNKKNDTQITNNNNFMNKVSNSLIDLFYIINPKEKYDDNTIKSLVGLMTNLGYGNKDSSFIKNRLSSIQGSNKQQTTTQNNNNKNNHQPKTNGT